MRTPAAPIPDARQKANIKLKRCQAQPLRVVFAWPLAIAIAAGWGASAAFSLLRR